ncbi:Aspartyl/glutamyl-tRNA(Asn/Gln) amidotransferase subunit B [Frankliniella fusca]|uniref:Aspartyl/glutamyl-tRNA(Asn/Gln) amidotransferase subunit B n=1 Tax=Frankliniella fusca TaxID=407009 RepID=A0AAE1HWF5_9NEOP|nr:Aspartyl/glutamyl-tRNA(Asn/Gln) amidotransferase subunit B [Frankliniella fusca]
MDTVPLYISVKAFDETDDGYLVMKVRVPANRVKYMVQGNIITLSTGTPALLLGVGCKSVYDGCGVGSEVVALFPLETALGKQGHYYKNPTPSTSIVHGPFLAILDSQSLKTFVAFFI